MAEGYEGNWCIEFKMFERSCETVCALQRKQCRNLLTWKWGGTNESWDGHSESYESAGRVLCSLKEVNVKSD